MEEGTSLQKRHDQSCGFRKILTGNWVDDSNEDKIPHNCSMDCDCVDEDDTRDRAHDQVDIMILRNLP